MTEPSITRKETPRWLVIRLFLCIVFLFLFLRIIHLDSWQLANVDEIALLNNLSLPTFSGGYGSTTFFPAVQITKAFFFVDGFPSYRYIGVLLNLAGLIFFFLALNKVTGKTWSLIGALAFSAQWYLVYISRIYEIATFVPFFFSLQFFLVISWLVSKKPAYLITSFIVAGIGIDCYAPPIFYATAALILILAYRAIRGAFSYRLLIACTTGTLIAMVPFFYVQLFVGDFFRDILANYQFAGKSSSDVLLIHLRHPEIFLKTITELFSFITLDHRWWIWLTPPVVLCLFVILILVIRQRKDSIVGFIGLWTFLTLVITFVSPVAAYIQGHFTAFLLLFLACLAVCIGRISGKERLFPLGILIIFGIASSLWLPNVFKNQWKEMAWATEFIAGQNEKSIPVSDGAFLALRHVPGFLQGKARVFTCDKVEHVRQGVEDISCNHPSLILATYECNIVDSIQDTCAMITEKQRLTTLLESHLANGVVIYRTKPKR